MYTKTMHYDNSVNQRKLVKIIIKKNLTLPIKMKLLQRPEDSFTKIRGIANPQQI